MRRFLATVLALLVLSGCTGRPSADASGAEIYDQLCARCHGAELGGGIGPALGAGSDVVERSDDYVRSVIENGRGSMPSFGSTLDDAQIDRLVGYLRTEQNG